MPSGDDDEWKRRERMDLESKFVKSWWKSLIHMFLTEHRARNSVSNEKSILKNRDCTCEWLKIRSERIIRLNFEFEGWDAKDSGSNKVWTGWPQIYPYQNYEKKERVESNLFKTYLNINSSPFLQF